MIPFVDLKKQYLSIKEDIDTAILDVLENTAFIGGKHVRLFEESFSQLLGVKNTISCANGTDSLYIIMKSLGIGLGDEVITVANSWISSSETITQTGAKVVFADCEPITFSMDVADVRLKITPKTKAILVVHLQGEPCDMEAYVKLCTKNDLYLIEDCAQSHLSEFKGQKVGTFGIAASFSFYPGKNLGAYGDAGCIITNNDELALKCKMFANHGALVKHEHQIEGINSRMDGIQAAILNVKMKHLEKWTEARRKVAATYNSLLQDLNSIKLPQSKSHAFHSYHLFVIQLEQRDELRSYLKEKGIDTFVHYPTSLPLLPAYAYLNYTEKDFPNAVIWSQRSLSLPIFPEMDKNQIGYVANTIKDFFI
jgi:dTDP-4-amino-4,6-dideoxygalactose transaminase